MRRLIGWITPKTTAHTAPANWWRRAKILVLATLGLVLISGGGTIYSERARVIATLHQVGADAGLKLRHIQAVSYTHLRAHETG